MSRGAKHNQAGLKAYEDWELEQSIEAFQKATTAEPENAEYYMNLTRAYARAGKYHEAMQSLGDYLRTETDPTLSERYERLFSSALDEVETRLIEGLQKLGVGIQHIGKAIQMWLEFRITIGRQPLKVMKPELWAGALAYTLIKINFLSFKLSQVAKTFGVNERPLKEKFEELVGTLDLMPADYRYFVGDKNPLDKLVEAAQIMEELDQRFHED